MCTPAPGVLPAARGYLLSGIALSNRRWRRWRRWRDSLAPTLPPGISAEIDGQRVYLSDPVRGMERTMDSAAAAQRTLEDWDQMLVPQGPC